MGQGILTQGGDEGLGVPVAKRRVIYQALANRCPAGCLYHVGLERGFVDKDEPFQMVAHIRLSACDPEAPRQCHVRAHLLTWQQRFFYG